jgi:hypothetical protein
MRLLLTGQQQLDPTRVVLGAVVFGVSRDGIAAVAGATGLGVVLVPGAEEYIQVLYSRNPGRAP